MSISSIRGLGRYIKNNSYFSSSTVNSVFIALGFNPRHSTQDEFRELSKLLLNCTANQKSEGYRRLFKYSEKTPFFKNHQKDIIAHMEQQAYEMDMDIIYMIQKYIIHQKKRKLTASEIGKAIWHEEHYLFEPLMLYNYLTKYVLCEISWLWYSYLEEKA